MHGIYIMERNNCKSYFLLIQEFQLSLAIGDYYLRLLLEEGGAATKFVKPLS